MRNSPYGSVQAAVAAAYKAAGGLEKVSEAIGLSVSSLSEANDPDKRPHGLGVNYLHILGQIKPAAAEAIANHFAALAGGLFQPLGRREGNACLFQISADAPRELGEAGSAIVRAAHDVSANRDEAVREIDEAIAILTRAKAEIIAGRGAAPMRRQA